MPRRASSVAAQERNNQKLNIDFFQIDGGLDEASRFGAILLDALNLHGAARYRTVGSEPLALFHLHHDGSLIEGEIGRVRRIDTPSITNRDCELSDINLNDDQDIVERTAFLYDQHRGVLIFHAKREAVSASRLAGYCDTFAGPASPSFVLEPVLRADVLDKYESITTFRKVEIKFAGTANTSLENPDQSTRAFVRGFRTLEANTAMITVSSQRGNRLSLVYEATRNLVSSCLRNRDRSVQRLVVSGSNGGDERLILDLLEGRLRAVITVQRIGRSLSYEQRRNAVRDAYYQNSSQLPGTPL